MIKTINIRQWQRDVKKYTPQQTFQLTSVYMLNLKQAMVYYEVGTGIIDHKSKEIFEGDIIERESKVYLVHRVTCKLTLAEMESKKKGWKLTGSAINLNDTKPMKIIGNIHDKEYKKILEEIEHDS